MSPPPGYPLHQGGSQDYGMGALGIDRSNGLVLFEIRGGPHRPDKIPMNAQIKRALLREYSDAQSFNSSLPPLMDSGDHASRYDILNRLESLLGDFKTIAEKVAQAIESPQGKSRENLRKVRIPMARRTLADCEKHLAKDLPEDLSAGVAPHVKELRQVLSRLEAAVSSPQLDVAIQNDLNAVIHAFDQELWRRA